MKKKNNSIYLKIIYEAILILALFLNLFYIRNFVFGTIVFIYYFGLNTYYLINILPETDYRFSKYPISFLILLSLMILIIYPFFFFYKNTSLVYFLVLTFISLVLLATFYFKKKESSSFKKKINKSEEVFFNKSNIYLYSTILLFIFSFLILVELRNTTKIHYVRDLVGLIPQIFFFALIVLVILITILIFSKINRKTIFILLILLFFLGSSLKIIVYGIDGSIPGDLGRYIGRERLIAEGEMPFEQQLKITDVFELNKISTIINKATITHGGFYNAVPLIQIFLNTNIIFLHIFFIPIIWALFLPFLIYEISALLFKSKKIAILAPLFFVLISWPGGFVTSASLFGLIIMVLSLYLWLIYFNDRSLTNLIISLIVTSSSLIIYSATGLVSFSIMIATLFFIYAERFQKKKYACFIGLSVLLIIINIIVYNLRTNVTMRAFTSKIFLEIIKTKESLLYAVFFIVFIYIIIYLKSDEKIWLLISTTALSYFFVYFITKIFFEGPVFREKFLIIGLPLGLSYIVQKMISQFNKEIIKKIILISILSVVLLVSYYANLTKEVNWGNLPDYQIDAVNYVLNETENQNSKCVITNRDIGPYLYARTSEIYEPWGFGRKYWFKLLSKPEIYVLEEALKEKESNKCYILARNQVLIKNMNQLGLEKKVFSNNNGEYVVVYEYAKVKE